jgi:hypothetical protein
LDLIHKHVGAHITIAARRAKELKGLAQQTFLSLAARAVAVLEARDLSQFEGIFADTRGFVLLVPCALETAEARDKLSLVNQLVHEILASQIKSVSQMARMESDSFNFVAIKSQVKKLRAFGGFAADRCTLLLEELKMCKHAEADDWLVKVSDLCHEHFAFGRDLSRIKLCCSWCGAICNRS